MSSIRSGLLSAMGFCLLLPAFALDPGAQPEIVLESPQKDAVYSTTSDVVVAGRCRRPGNVGTAQFKDSRNVIQQNANFQTGVDLEEGAWSCRLAVPQGGPQAWKPGTYAIDIRPVGSAPLSLPITIVADPAGPAKAAPAPVTSIRSEEYKILPRLNPPAVTLSSPDKETPELTDREKTHDRSFEIRSNQEFAVEGEYHLKERGDFVPSEVILRLVAIDQREGAAQKNRTLIVSEALAKYHIDEDTLRYRYRAVLRAPGRPGRLTLQVIYRRSVISTAAVDIRATSKN